MSLPLPPPAEQTQHAEAGGKEREAAGSGVEFGSPKIKSSMATTSGSSWPSPKNLFPLVILMRLTIGEPKSTPKKEKVWFPANAGAKNVPRLRLSFPKKVNEVVFTKSTSLKMTPKPRVSAASVAARHKEIHINNIRIDRRESFVN